MKAMTMKEMMKWSLFFSVTLVSLASFADVTCRFENGPYGATGSFTFNVHRDLAVMPAKLIVKMIFDEGSSPLTSVLPEPMKTQDANGAVVFSSSSGKSGEDYVLTLNADGSGEFNCTPTGFELSDCH